MASAPGRCEPFARFRRTLIPIRIQTRGTPMRMTTAALGLVLVLGASGRADPPKPSLGDELSGLQGKWETDPKSSVKAILEVKTAGPAGRAKTRVDLAIGPKPKLKVTDDEVSLKEVGGKRVIAWSEVVGELGGQGDVEY